MFDLAEVLAEDHIAAIVRAVLDGVPVTADRFFNFLVGELFAPRAAAIVPSVAPLPRGIILRGKRSAPGANVARVQGFRFGCLSIRRDNRPQAPG